MRKVVLLFTLLISTYSYSKDKSFYLGFNLINGINFPVGNNSKGSAYAPTLELLFEKKLSKKISLQTGLLLIDRAYNYDYVVICPCKDGFPGHYKENRNTLYAASPFYVKINWNKIYLTSGMSLNFPVYNYYIIKSPKREVVSFWEVEDRKDWILSLNLKFGYDFHINKNTITLNGVFNYDIFERYQNKLFSNSLLSVGLGIGYKFKFSKTN